MNRIFFLFLSIIPMMLFAEQKGPVAVFLADQGFKDVEYYHTVLSLDSAQIPYFIFSGKDDTLYGIDGMKVCPFTVTDSVKNYSPSSLIIIGGPGIMKYTENEKMAKLIRWFDENNLLIGAICLGPVLLIKAGIVRDRKISVFESSYTSDLIEKYSIKYHGSPAVISGNLVTSPSPEYSKSFIKAFIGEYNAALDSESKKSSSDD